MIIQFHIHYKTNNKTFIAIQYFSEGKTQTVQMLSYDNENWILSLEFENITSIQYKYVLQEQGNHSTFEWGQNRHLHFSDENIKYYYVNDFWNSRENIQNVFLSSAFTEAIFSRNQTKKPAVKSNISSNYLEIDIAVTLPPHLSLGIIGNNEQLGKWLKPIPMSEENYPNWKIKIPVEEYDIFVHYKFVLLDKKTNEIMEWEVGENRSFRRFLPEIDKYTCIIHDSNFRFGSLWKGTGVAIPIFSLRSKNGLGIGEYTDLIPFIDWSENISLKTIQVLPVNDTIANKTWQDSYPYAAISVFALHPMYVNVSNIGKFNDPAITENYQRDITELNKLDQVDFEKVLEKKWFYFKILFEQNKNTLFQKKGFKDFIKENKTWLIPYAAFCVLRDENGTCRYDEWKQYKLYDKEVIFSLFENDTNFADKVNFYIFIQFHAHIQLTEARNYARSKSIALKGDLPIGIYRYSCDAWVAPHLYNMDEQAGAPPDDFSELGQNWGFPTYNWEEMAKDDFSWWKFRLRKLNEYFDILRIDHILGFFRIWQIPTRQVSGTMGLFNPRIPFNKDEIIQSGLTGSIERYTEPFLTEELILHHFKDNPALISTFFTKKEEGMYGFSKTFPDQISIQKYILSHKKWKDYEPILLKLFTEVIFIEEKIDGQMVYNPRITVHTTYSFSCLDEQKKTIVKSLYNQYYFKRHDEFWKEQALWKLPALLDASNMMICGEDLGMIPNAVPGVMKALNIMSLEIQRMPKGNARFGNVQEYPYFSVSSPSCHDMSTIRGWWESDHEMAKEYFYQYMHGYGYTPMKCEPRIVQFVIEDHLSGPAMLAIFPLQDLLGIDADLRRLDADTEQINEPSNPKHYWRFRFHMNIEDLKGQKSFNDRLSQLIKKYRPT
ncbi:MAG: 4-alpha-glucanotransferase [Saprospiraceae bacterium]|nr:4-alpha-glucanotransferase [Saprospiraceae bacterium]MBK9044859.1 4-alpha-glucanotransferase [Saprospiraceae bacterium]MBP6694436.1 4-alpha-glucanotransferase [Saprospiraceae bacterium]